LVATYGTQTSTVILQNNNKLVATYGTQTSTDIDETTTDWLQLMEQ
jgi:hypothetical protein